MPKANRFNRSPGVPECPPSWCNGQPTPTVPSLIRDLARQAEAAASWPGAIGQYAAGQLPWGHIMVLLDKVTDPVERDWYAAAAVEHG